MNLFDNIEQKSLCVIGNGFDLHHGLKTKYSDFRNYLVRSGNEDYVAHLECFFPTESVDEKGERCFLLWSDLEDALGHYDLESIYYELTGCFEVDFDHMMRTAFQIEDAPYDLFAPLVDQLPTLLAQWISQVPYYGVYPDVSLPSHATYLSFNYTKVLEDIYHIPLQDILHIHGVVGEESKLVVGHCTIADEIDAFDEDAPLFQEESMRHIIRIMNECLKPSSAIIENNIQFFNSLRTITDIYIFGHSYSMVDYAYFEKIKEAVSYETNWHLGVHSEADRTAAKGLMNTLDVDDCFWGMFKF